MINYLGYFFLGAGIVLFLFGWFDKSRNTMPLMFAATMLVMGGLTILQFLGTEAPNF
jgi:hypothetical protein